MGGKFEKVTISQPALFDDNPKAASFFPCLLVYWVREFCAATERKERRSAAFLHFFFIFSYFPKEKEPTHVYRA